MEKTEAMNQNIVLDDLARAGLGSIHGGAGGVTVTWRGSKARR
jgi:hypothetical protein